MREHTTNNILVSIPSSLLATYDACVLVSAQTVSLMLIMPRTYMEAQAEGRPFRAIVVIILSWILHSTGSQLSGPETAVPTTKVGWADTGMAHHQLMERQRLVGGADGGQTPHFQLNPKLGSDSDIRPERDCRQHVALCERLLTFIVQQSTAGFGNIMSD